jgi:DNA-binding PadR family transcriptional regulator
MLALLLDGPLHGYALKKQAGILSGKPDLHNNLVYPLLRRFVRLGWVTQKKAAGERGQTRRMYSLTAKGRRALLDRLSAFPQEDAHSSQAFELRVGLFAYLDPAARRAILDHRIEHLRGQQGRLDQLRTKMDLGDYGEEVVRFKRERATAEIAWIERIARKSSKSQSGQRNHSKQGR